MHRYTAAVAVPFLVFSFATSERDGMTRVSAQEISTRLASDLPQEKTVEITESELARLIGPRALSRAFRVASRRAGPGVVTILSYGQGQRPPAKKPEPKDAPEINPNPDFPLPKGSDEDEEKWKEDFKEGLPDDLREKLEQQEADQESADGDEDEAAEEESESGEAPIEPDEELGPAPPTQSPDDPDAVLTGLGSGVIVDPTGLIITNSHVIKGASKVVVQMPDEIEYSAVKILGDPDSDIAILRIESSSPLPAVEVGNSDIVDIGDWVLAIGSPFKLEATVSAGIISAKNRKLRRIKRGQLLQTDAAINPGNSGGPLIDLDGKVIAINTAIASRNGGNQGIGFAIPINQAIWLARELDQYGKVRRATLGIRLAELNPKYAKALDVEPGIGLWANQIIADGAADKAGMENNDIILEFAGKSTNNMVDLQEIVERSPIGSTQTIRILRDGEEIELEIVLAPREDPTAVVDNP